MPFLRAPALLLTPVLLLAACASQPNGPTVAVMPAPGKPFEVFQGDQAMCKSYADGQVAGEAQQANNKQVLTGVVGTVLGAGLGAAIGGGRGAGIGAGAGALGGTAFGAGPSERSNYSVQGKYNIAYSQCMYARGNQVPGFQPATGYPPPPGTYSGAYPGSYSGAASGGYPNAYPGTYPGAYPGSYSENTYSSRGYAAPAYPPPYVTR